MDSEYPNLADLAAQVVLQGPVGILLCDDAWVVTWANPAAISMLDGAGETLLGKSFKTWHKSIELPQIGVAMKELYCSGNSTVRVLMATSRSEHGYLLQLTPAECIGKKIAKLAYQESIWRHAVEAAELGVWDYNANNEASFHSTAWKRMRGLPIDKPFVETLEQWLERLHPDDRATTLEHVEKHNSGEVENFSFEYRERTTAGNYIWILARGRAVEWNSFGVPTRLLGTDIDITALKEQEERRSNETMNMHRQHVLDLEYEHQQTDAARQIAHVLSRQDPLTQLPNRRVFSDEIVRLMQGGSHARPFAVLLIDLDRFKPVNDLYGHAAGDFIIRASAERLLAVVGSGGVTARLGGDEFGVIVQTTSLGIEETSQAYANKIIASLSEPMPIGGFNVEIGASIGIALYPEDGDDATSLFRHADMALYDGKLSGRGRFKFYDSSIGDDAEAKAKLESAVRLAVTREEFAPNFQPIVDLASGDIVALEVLARWRNCSLGQIGPDRFIPIIDQFNMMPDFTLSILRQACAAGINWSKRVALSMNLSAKEVCDLSTPLRILQVLADTGMQPSRLKIEVTEQALMHDLESAKRVIGAFRSAGVKVMLDDFGAGYAGLGYLRELKFDSIKIDRSFVTSLVQQSESTKIVDAMLTLAKNLELETVAEGIEDEDTMLAIRSLGCELGQGYFFSRAIPAEGVDMLFKMHAEDMKKSA